MNGSITLPVRHDLVKTNESVGLNGHRLCILLGSKPEEALDHIEANASEALDINLYMFMYAVR